MPENVSNRTHLSKKGQQGSKQSAVGVGEEEEEKSQGLDLLGAEQVDVSRGELHAARLCKTRRLPEEHRVAPREERLAEAGQSRFEGGGDVVRREAGGGEVLGHEAAGGEQGFEFPHATDVPGLSKEAFGRQICGGGRGFFFTFTAA